MKIGIIGGSFDPVHYGHLILADQIINEASLDKIVFAPMTAVGCDIPGHMACAADRLALLKLAAASNPRFELSDVGLDEAMSLHMDGLMEKLKARYPDDELYLVLGQDSFMDIEQWHNYEELLKNNKILIGQRPGESTKELFGLFKTLFARFKHLSIEFFDIPEVNITSATVRNKIKVGKSVKYLIPDECIEYIQANNLYDSLIPKLKDFVKSNVKPHRYEHTKGVVDTARKLAVRYGVDIKKAETAAWFHDAFRSAGNLEHGPLAAEMIQQMFGVNDPEIIEAIRNHTTGHPGMTRLDKIIYVADSLEPGRVFPGVDGLRKIMYVDLDECLYELMVHTREYVISIGSQFSPISDKAIEELKEKLGK